MNSIYKKGVCLLMAGLAFILLTACSSDDESYHVPGAENFTRDMFVGEWFEPAGEGNYGIGHYHADGSLTTTSIHATKSEWDYSVSEGYWEFSDGILTVVSNVKHEGILNTTTKGVYQIQKLPKYELWGSSLDMDLTTGGYRIVDTYQMNVGEKRQVIINDSEFRPQEYSSVNHHVASVDDEGTIEARHLGTTFILIKSSIGTAVIRVVVNDSANDFNDALQSLGMPIQTITKEYGQIYLEKTQENGNIIRHYYLPDDKVMNIRFQTDADGYVNIIQQYFSNFITPDEVRASLSRKYDFQRSAVDEEEGPYSVYTTTWQCRKVNILYFENPHQILIAFQNGDDNLAKYDDFFNQVMNMNASLGLVAYSLGYTLTGQDYLNKSFTTSAPYPFKQVEVVADENWYVNCARLYFDDNITFQDVEYYIKRYYLPTSYPDLFLNSLYTYFLGYVEDENGYLQFLQYDKRTTE